jgi:adenosyl cobinamide kinase/adenosyl cobinamide phosphate guanylyltransferase
VSRSALRENKETGQKSPQKERNHEHRPLYYRMIDEPKDVQMKVHDELNKWPSRMTDCLDEYVSDYLERKESNCHNTLFVKHFGNRPISSFWARNYLSRTAIRQ